MSDPCGCRRDEARSVEEPGASFALESAVDVHRLVQSQEARVGAPGRDQDEGHRVSGDGLTAAGASSFTRRSLAAVTAGGLAFLGVLLGTMAAYVGLAGWFRSNALEGGLSDIIDHIPWDNLFLIVIAMPVIASLVGWLLAGRQPEGIASRPAE